MPDRFGGDDSLAGPLIGVQLDSERDGSAALVLPELDAEAPLSALERTAATLALRWPGDIGVNADARDIAVRRRRDPAVTLLQTLDGADVSPRRSVCGSESLAGVVAGADAKQRSSVAAWARRLPSLRLLVALNRSSGK
jgi:hypothetical protein